MLRMISLKERAKIVFSVDDAIRQKKKDSKEAKVLHLSEVEVLEGKKPTVFTVRLLNSRERMQMAESAGLSQTQALFTASEKAVVAINGPGVKAEDPDKVAECLLSLDPEIVYTLAGWIMEQSSLKPDPLGQAK